MSPLSPTAGCTTHVPDSVMKLNVGTSVVGVSQGMPAGKGVGLVGVVASEAEALRKDPLKNYVGLLKLEM
jgi:hypothetical protein